MKKTRSVSVISFVVTLLVVVLSAPGWAQTTTATAGGVKTITQINPPPCDFSDLFYRENGIDPTQLVGRFGSTRQTGSPASNRNAMPLRRIDRKAFPSCSLHPWLVGSAGGVASQALIISRSGRPPK